MIAYFCSDPNHKDLTQKEIANARIQVCLFNKMYQIKDLFLLVMASPSKIKLSVHSIWIIQQSILNAYNLKY